MNKYELTIVLDGKSGSAKKKKIEEVIASVLKLFKGEIKESKDWGVKELAYKIGKSETGLYLFYNLELVAEGVKALNDKLRTDAEILRFLLINPEK